MPRYKNNQITEMLCQIRFSTILKINNESNEELSKFQDQVYEKYPNYTLLNENLLNVEMKNMDANIDNITPQILRSNVKNHMFVSKDNTSKINLTPNFISISTQKYECWSKFKEEIKWALEKFNIVYNVNIYNRIGIRYINAFSKKELGIDEKDGWNKYISDEIVGLSSKYPNVTFYNSQIEIPFSDNSQMRIVSGLGIKQNEYAEPVFILDKDTYKLGNIEKANVDSIIEELHAHNSEVFESLIKEDLREKMGVVVR